MSPPTPGSAGPTPSGASARTAPAAAPAHAPPLLDRRDWGIIAGVTLAWLALALFQLGDFRAPQTGWKPVRAGEGFVADLGAPRDITRICFYEALGDGSLATGSYRLDYTDETGTESGLGLIRKNDVFTWNCMAGQPTRTARIRVTVEQPGGALGEIAFFERDARQPVTGVRITGAVVDPRDEGRPGNLFDEPGTAPLRPTHRNGMVFDEVLFARTAYEHLHRIEPYETAHPPLGKDIIALGILLFGMTPFGWRIMAVLFGAALLPAMYAFGKRLFGDRFSATAALLLTAVDFLHFTLSRLGTVDIFVVFFVVLSYYFMSDYFLARPSEQGHRASLAPLCLSGLCFGLGVATKWNAAYGAPGLLLLFVLARRREHLEFRRLRDARRSPAWTRDYPRRRRQTLAVAAAFFLAVPAVIYTLAYIPFLMVPGPGHTPADLLPFQAFMYNFHRNLQETHPFQSAWWEWPLILKPIWVHVGRELPAGRAATIAAMGHPLTWWAGGPAMIAAAFIAIRKRERAAAVLFAAGISLYLPWMVVTRVSFIYHFLPILPFVLLGEVFVMKTLVERHRWGRPAAVGFLAAAVVLFVVFFPAISGLEVGSETINHLRWLKSWRF